MSHSVISTVKRFFSTRNLLKDWNRTLLVLVPNVNPPEEVSHLRPISLCNVIYKCISKCIVFRMTGILPTLITDFQTTFVPGR